MQDYLELMITAFATFMAASAGGFWIYVRQRRSTKDANTRLLMGLAHDKILTYGMQYLEQGYVTQDQYEDLRVYLYDPYIELGGNGTAERIMHLVDRLPLSDKSALATLADNTQIRSTDRTAHESDTDHDRPQHPRRRASD